jgi:hypothetical protein
VKLVVENQRKILYGAKIVDYAFAVDVEMHK